VVLETTTTVEPETTTTEAPQTTTTAAKEPILLEFATTFAQTEPRGRIIQRFVDYVEEGTEGAVKYEVFFDGALGTGMEELGLVSSGSVDMISLNHLLYADQLPLLNFPMWAPPDAQTAIDYFNFLCFEDHETSVLIQKEAATSNILLLGFVAGGGNVFISKEPFEGLADLAGGKFGVDGFASAFEGLGYSIVPVLPQDTYGSLSGGVIDTTHMGLDAAVNLKLYEIARHYRFDGTYAAGNAFSVNLDTWEKLTPEIQAIFREAAEDAETFSLELSTTEAEAAIAMLRQEGAEIDTLSDEDRALWWNTFFSASAAGCMTRAANLGILDDMTPVLTKAAEFTGTTWPID
jgi:TRAP-type C4-dicarboxylate transport system substrate-binding protein